MLRRLLLCVALAGCSKSALAPVQHGRSAVAPVTEGKPIAAGLRAQVLLSPEQTGFPGASLALLELELAHSLPMQRHPGDALWFVLEGDGQLFFAGGQTTLNAREGVWLPGGAVHGFEATSRTRLLTLYTPPGPERRYTGGGDPGTAAVDAADAANTPRPVEFQPNAAAPLRIGGGTGVVRLGLEATDPGPPPASCALLELQPGGAVPEHAHAGEAEILYVFEGAARLVVDGREETVTAPAALLLAPGVRHEVTVTSAVPFRAVQWYTPPGPEQRFKKTPP